MSKDEIKMAIKNAASEEAADIDKYSKLYEEFRKLNLGHCAGVVSDIRHDEEMHHKYLTEIMNLL